MASEHTPGPWTYERQDSDYGTIYYAIHGANYEFVTNVDESEANASLIAEAGTVASETGMTPRQLADGYESAKRAVEILKAQRAELLTLANQYLRQCWDDWHSHMSQEQFDNDPTVKAIRAAIAKATGGA